MTSGRWVRACAGGLRTQCVEVRAVGDVIEVRDSKHPDGPVLRFTPGEWAAWLDGAKKGEFDHLV